MTSIQQFIKDLQEKFPNQMKDMWENNQFLIEDITLKAKQMHKQEIIEAREKAPNLEAKYKGEAEDYYNYTYEKEN